MNVFSDVSKSSNAMQPWVLWMGDIGNLILSNYLATPRSFLVFAGDFSDNSVSTYSLMMFSAL